MIKVNNYTESTELEFNDTVELEDYRELHHEDDEVMYTIDAIGMTGYDNCIEWLDLETHQRNLAIAVTDRLGHGYFKNLTDLLGEWDNIGLQVIEHVSNARELAHKLEYDFGYEEALFSILGCTEEAYEQLGSYITTDALASTLDTDCNIAYVDNTAYMFTE